MCRAGRVDVSRSGKAIRPCPHAALLQKLKEKEGKSKKSRGFSMSCGLVVLTRKNRGKLSIVESFLLPASARLSRHIKSETKFSKFSIVIGHMIKYSSGKHLALRHGARTSLRLVCTSWNWANLFPVRPDQTKWISTYFEKNYNSGFNNFFFLAAADSIIGRCARKRGCKAKTKH